LLPELGDSDVEALKVVSLLKTGSGGMDWSGLPLVAGWMGITDLDGLLERLAVILQHHRTRED
jgi:hypothetical protein